MFRIWFERDMPRYLEATMSGVAEAIGPGTATPHDPAASIGAAEAIIASALMAYDGPLMDRAPRLQVIARTGIGTDNVDLTAATERGIAVCNTPDAPTRSTAEHTITLMLTVAKRVPAAQKALRSGGRDFFGAHEGLEMAGRTLGLVGLGRIGRTVAGIAAGLGMSVVAYDPFVDPASVAGSRVRTVGSLETLVGEADVISLHVPLTDETHHMVDRRIIGMMKPDAILINTARGGLVDHVALLDALERRDLFGVGLDATDPEPLPPDHPLLSHAHAVVTPHVAAATFASKQRLYASALAQAFQVLRGERPDHLVNPTVWPLRRPDPTP